MNVNRASLSTIVLTALLISTTHSNAANSNDKGYLHGATLNYGVPPPPSDSAALKLDLVEVRSSQQSRMSGAWKEADADAVAYSAPDILRRFSDASGQVLIPENRPMLVFMLAHIIADTSAYASQAKALHPRPRPYIEDGTIQTCNRDRLGSTESYPSGHAMNGYAVAITLAMVLPPDREQDILARGIRYGTNRVVCGVHHPTDVEQGQLFAIAYMKVLAGDWEFQRDLDCARQENAQVSNSISMSNQCVKRSVDAREWLSRNPQ